MASPRLRMPLPDVPGASAKWESRAIPKPSASKDPPTPRQPPRLRLAGAGLPPRVCAAAMAFTTKDGGGVTSQMSLRGAAGPPRVPSGSPREEGLGKVFWSSSRAKRHRQGEEWAPKHVGLAPGWRRRRHGNRGWRPQRRLRAALLWEGNVLVTWAGLTVAKWPGLRLPRPGHKTKRSHSL